MSAQQCKRIKRQVFQVKLINVFRLRIFVFFLRRLLLQYFCIFSFFIFFVVHRSLRFIFLCLIFIEFYLQTQAHMLHVAFKRMQERDIHPSFLVLSFCDCFDTVSFFSRFHFIFRMQRHCFYWIWLLPMSPFGCQISSRSHQLPTCVSIEEEKPKMLLFSLCSNGCACVYMCPIRWYAFSGVFSSFFVSFFIVGDNRFHVCSPFLFFFFVISACSFLQLISKSERIARQHSTAQI